MKKNIKLFLISLLSVLSFSMVGVACNKVGGNNNGNDVNVTQPKEYEITDFQVAKEIEVAYGENYLISVPCVTDNYDNALDCTVEVFDSTNKKVDLVCYSFFVLDSNGYTIRYSVKDYANKTHARETIVKVKGSKELTVKGVQVYDVGDTVSILPESKLQNPTYTYEVKLNGEPVTLTDTEGGKAFVAETAGLYQATVKGEAEGKQLSHSYEILVRNAVEEGEVEKYDEYWNASRKLASLGTYDWEVVHTEDSNVKNRLGEDAYLLKKSVGVGELYSDARFYLNPRQDLDAYLAATDEGYTTLSVWVYTPSAGEYKITVHRSLSPYSGGGGSDVILKQNTWTEVRMQIKQTSNIWAGSFEGAYENYKTQVSYMLKIVGAQKQVPFDVYVSDVYITKDNNAAENTQVSKTAKVGDRVDLANFVNAENAQFIYDITDDYGNAYRLNDGETFVPTHNGNFYASILVNPVSKLQASKTVKTLLTVEDDVVLTGNSLIKERAGETVRTEFAELNASMTHATAEITLANREVLYYDEAYIGDANGFTASKDGMYAVRYCGAYTLNGLECKSYQTLTVDVFSEATKYSVANVENMLTTYVWTPSNTSFYRTNVIEDENGKMLEVGPQSDRNQVLDTFAVSFRPTFSKNYYQSLLSDGSTAVMQTGTYVTANCWVREWLASDGSEKMVNGGNWYEAKGTLQTLIDNYDKYVSTYQSAKMKKQGWQSGSMRHVEYVLVEVGDYYTDDHNTGVCKIKEVNLVVRPKLDSYVEEVEYLVEKTGVTSVDKLGTSAITGNNQKSSAEFLAGYASRTEDMSFVFENVVTTESKTLTSLAEIQSLASGRYQLTVELDFNTIYTAPVDVYSESEEFTWTDYSSTKYASVPVNHPNNNGIKIETASEHLTGKYYKLGNNAGNLTWGNFTVNPLHSKAYYQMFADKDFKYTIGFVSANTSLTGEILKVKGYTQTASTEIASGNTITVTIPMSVILENFDSVNLVTKTGATVTTDGWTYLGNFCVVEPIKAYTETVEYLVDKKSVTSFDKLGSTTVSGENTVTGQAYLAGYAQEVANISFAFTDIRSEKTYEIDNIGKLSTVPSARYQVTAKLNGSTLYTAPIDLYDSDEGFVWNDYSSTSYCAYTGPNQYGYKIVNNPSDNLTGSYYQLGNNAGNLGWGSFTVKPLHSYAYYQLYKDMNLQYTIGFVSEATENIQAENITVKGYGQSSNTVVANLQGVTFSVSMAKVLEDLEAGNTIYFAAKVNNSTTADGWVCVGAFGVVEP